MSLKSVYFYTRSVMCTTYILEQWVENRTLCMPKVQSSTILSLFKELNTDQDNLGYDCCSEQTWKSCNGRVVKALDSKSNGIFPRRFKPYLQRLSSEQLLFQLIPSHKSLIDFNFKRFLFSMLLTFQKVQHDVTI